MITLYINGSEHQVDVPNDKPLLWVLRDDLRMTGTKFGCGAALCGACTVHIAGNPARACVVPVGAAVGRSITTVEGVGATPLGKKVQQVWTELNVPQCGYCQSGQVMAAVALLERNPKPNDAEIDQAMSGNICRCGVYPRIRMALHRLAGEKM
jgi:isoquinoline 1-oxidoreductase subunit alpha